MHSKALLACSALFAGAAYAVPSRGHFPFVIAMCKHSDKPAEPITQARVRQFFTSAGTFGSQYDYFKTQSMGLSDMDGTFVVGWFTTKKTAAQTAALSRFDRVNVCRQAVIDAGTVIPANYKFLALFNETPDVGEVGSPGGGVVIDAQGMQVILTGHEIFHTLGAVHSYGQVPGSQPAVYQDAFDIMSTESIPWFQDGVFGADGPNLCAYNRDRFGWIPINRIFVPGPHTTRQRVTLTALGNPNGNDFLMARVPMRTAAGQPRAYYTLEMRNTAGYDKSLMAFSNPSGIIVHQVIESEDAHPVVQRRGTNLDAFYRANDVFADSTGLVTVRVVSVGANTAVVEISTNYDASQSFYGPNTCKQGLVWREADKSDYACVSPQRRTDVANENKGPWFTCPRGTVWREAWKGDYVCVSPALRALAQSESRVAYTNVANDWTSDSIIAGPASPTIP